MKAKIRSNANGKIRITACTITKNEEKHIATSIRSYRKYVDQIIVVDTGSTDKTKEIARNLGAIVYDFKWCDDFAKAKNAALERADGDWVVFLDADEYFGEDTCKNLRQSIEYAEEHNKNSIMCYMVNIDVIHANRKFAVNKSIRVFKNEYRFHFPIHEEIDFKGDNRIFLVDKNIFFLYHTGYNESISKSKGERNLQIILRDMKECNDHRRIISYYYYLCDTYFTLNEFQKAVDYGLKYIDLSIKEGFVIVGFETRPYSNVVNCYEQLKVSPEKVTPFTEKYLSVFPDSPDSLYASGCNDYNLQLFESAYKKLSEALEIIDKGKENAQGVMLYRKNYIYYVLGRCCEAMYRATDAVDFYYKSFAQDDSFSKPLFALLSIIKNYPKKQLDEFVKSLYTGKFSDRKVQVLSALLEQYMPDQIVDCYARVKNEQNEERLDVSITAYLMAAKGKFDTAAGFMKKADEYEDQDNRKSLAAVYAALSGDKAVIDSIKDICPKPEAWLFGFIDDLKVNDVQLSAICDAMSRCKRLGRIDFAVEKFTALSKKLTEKQLLKCNEFFIFSQDFDLGLLVAELSPISPNSVYYRAYYLYRLGSLNKAEDLLKLAKKMRCKKPAIDFLIEYIEKVKPKDILRDSDKTKVREQIENDISSGKLVESQKKIESYQKNATDAESYALEAVLMYYNALYKKAALAAECGLMIKPDDFDLLYNKGLIYERLSKPKEAAGALKKALKNCNDPAMAQSIEQQLSQCQ